MFGIGTTELLIILIFGFLIFGPDKLPKMAKTAGHAIAKFREFREEAKETINFKELIDSDAEDPFKDSMEAVSNLKDSAIKSAKELKEDATQIASETKESLQERKVDVEKMKEDYDKKRQEKKSEKS